MEEQEVLVQYLNANHGLYVEGNDWVADHRNSELIGYFGIEYAGVSGDGAVTVIDSDANCRFGRNSFGYTRAGYAINRPDYMDVLEGAEPILTSNGDYLRAAFFDGHNAYRTYGKSISFVGMDNSRNFDRAEYLHDVIVALAGYRGTVRGTVYSNLLRTPVEGATVGLPGGYLCDVTDAEGNFAIDRIPTEQFTLNLECHGYTTIENAEFSFDGENVMNVELYMRHPILSVDPPEIGLEVEQNGNLNYDIQISNLGDGPLMFSSSLHAAHVESQPWDIIDGFDAGTLLEDTRLQAAIFLNGCYWFAGGGGGAEDPNLLYKVSLDGELIETFEQGTESNYGWRDLTTDGEYIYAVDADYIAQIDPETGLQTDNPIRGQEMPNPMQCITYDPENEYFWVAGPTTNLMAFDRQGSWERLVSNRNRFRMSGLAWYADDPDGYQLYISSANERVPVMMKVNWQTQEEMFVCGLERFEGETPGGGEMTDQIVPYTTTLIAQMQGREDWIRSFVVGSRFEWIQVFPSEGELDPEGSMPFTLKLDGTGLTIGETYYAHVQIDHNTPAEGALWIDLELTAVEPHNVTEQELIPFEFGISAVYPNPFNPTTTIDYTLDRTSNISIGVYDLSGRLIENMVSGELNAGHHATTISGEEWTSGIYLIRLSDGNRVSQRKITLIK